MTKRRLEIEFVDDGPKRWGAYTTAHGDGWPKEGFVTTSVRHLDGGGIMLILEPASAALGELREPKPGSTLPNSLLMGN